MSDENSLHRRKMNDDAELTASASASPDAGIRSMEERLEYLRAELAKWTAAQERYPARADDMTRRITDLQAAIADTQAWLADYRIRRDGSS
jgi:hypothetical protein